MNNITEVMDTSGSATGAVETLFQQAVEAHQNWDFEAAESLYRQVLEGMPLQADARHNLGVLLAVQLQRPYESLSHFEAALDVDPCQAQFWFSYIDGLIRCQHYALARQVLPVAQSQGLQRSMANALIERLPQLEPVVDLPAVQNPSDREMQSLVAMFKQKNYVQGEAIARSFVQRFPESGFAWKALGTMLQPQGRREEALAAKIRAVQLLPNDSEALLNLGRSYFESGFATDAIGVLRACVAISPANAEALNYFGMALDSDGQTFAAKECYERALAVQPNFLKALLNLSTIYGAVGDVNRTIALLEQVLELQGDYKIGFDNLLVALNHHPEKSAEDIYKSYCGYEQRFGAPFRQQWTPHANDRSQQRRLKVGYVFPDFSQHACRFFLEPLLSGHDHGAVELYAYADLTKEDATTQRYRQYFEHWVPARDMGDNGLAQRIRADGIDILVDLAGHTAGNRLGVFALKPAPVSLSWLGCRYTTGLKAIDYYLTDEVSTPPGSENVFSEQLWRLPARGSLAYRPDPAMGAAGPLPALANGYITFGALTRGICLNHRTIWVWAEILRRIPNSHLVVDSSSFKDPGIQQTIGAKFEAHGIDAARLHVGFHNPPWDVLRGLDIGLDCFPHNSETTLFESLYMGLPFVTLAGRSSVGRLGASILQGLGRPEWIAHSEEDYVEKAVALASNLPVLVQLRATLRTQMQASSLMDEAGFARQMEHAYAQMFARWTQQDIAPYTAKLPLAVTRRNQPSPDEMRLVLSFFEFRDFVAGAAAARELVHLYPCHGFGWKALGTMLHPLGQFEEALRAKRKAFQLMPQDAEAASNLGHSLQYAGHYAQAETVLQRALVLRADYPEAHNNLGITYQKMGRIADAIFHFQTALVLKPHHKWVFDNYLFTLNYHPDVTAEDVFEAYREYEKRFGELYRVDWQPHDNSRSLGRRLKVGYVSPDFRNHACTFFLEPLLAQHDPALVEITAYADLNTEDAATLRYRGLVAHWVPTRGLSDSALAQRIRDDGIDILVDLAGHTEGNRLGVFARKPAPVSLSWMGYGYTTGLRAVDYFLTDAISVPMGSEPLFSEEPWRLPGPSLAVYRPGAGMGEVNALPALAHGRITLGTLTRAVRINHHTIRVWCEILQRMPTAHLVVNSHSFQDPGAQKDLLQKFMALGIEADRLHIGCTSPPWDVLRSMDIGLDCFPHNSGTTLFETLYMGLPFVTLAGRPSVGRMGSAILHGLGHPEWIAHSEEEYINTVVNLASDLPALAHLRATLRAQMQASSLMDEKGFAGKVEQAYAQMFERWAIRTALDAVEASPTADEMNGLVALFNDQSYAQGVEILHLLVARYPRHGYSWKLLGSFLQKLNQVAPALQAKQRAVQLLPNDMEALFNLAMAYEQQGMVLKAEPCYRTLTAQNPADAEVHHNLGNTLLRQGRYTEAIPCYRQSLRIKPDFVASYHSLAWLLQNLGQLVEAEIILRSLLQWVPHDTQVSMQLGRVLLQQGRTEEAKVCIRNATNATKDTEMNPVQQGNSFMELGLWSDAEAEFRKALEIDPTADQVWVNLANCLKNQSRLVEANKCALQAIEVNPNAMVAWATHASVMLMVGDRSAAEAGLRRAMELSPRVAANFASLLFMLNYDPDRSAEEIYENYAEFDRQFGVIPPALLIAHDNPPAARRRLKVGYVSPDFKNHVCTFFTEPLLSQHDANLVEVYAYAELTHEDASSRRYKAYVEHWIPTMGMSDMAVAQRIRADGIDVLVDLAGHTSGNRLGVFAYKPAPVSLSWMGYGYTTGLRSIDYYLTDVVGVPMGSEHLFAEKPWRLPDTAAWVYRPPHAVMGAVNLLPAMERGYVTLGTLTRGIRLNHLTIRVWAAILQRLPTAHIVIDSSSFKDHSVQQSLVDQFTALGIGENRLHIGFSSPPWDVLRGIDIGLDCFPHNSGTTLFETLYMGLPFVTLAGRPSVGRLGSTILQGLGRPEWIAHTEDEYIEKVVALASDLPALAHIRATQRAKMAASQLMDEAGFARKVEVAYAQMFALWEEKNA